VPAEFPRPYERKIEDVVDALRRAQEQEGAVILLGAGCSKTAGIPLAPEFCSIIKERYPRDYERAEQRKKVGYQDLMAEISAGERRDLLAEHIDNAKLNWAHIALAELIKQGYIARVLTPNFDPLVVQACALLNVFPAIYDLAASQTFKAEFVTTPAVIYLHGQRSGFRLLNTERECEEHAMQLRPVFDEAGARRPWIVLGYSGENDPVFDHLLAERHFDYRLHWIGYGDAPPSPHLRKKLFVDGKQAFWVPRFDADQFLTQLAARLGCFPPDLVRRPFSHLRSSFDLIGTYDLRDSSGETVDLLGTARGLVESAIDSLEREPESPEERESELLTTVRGRLISGDYEEAVRLSGEAKSKTEELFDLEAWAFVLWGNALSDQAERVEGEAAQRLFAEAGEKYAQALEIKPDKYEALFNWGLALADQAKRAEGEAAQRLLAEAGEKYAQALKIKPDEHEALYNWGNALSDRAERAEGETAQRLLAEAGDKYAQALEIKPDMHEALNNWGLALANQAKRAEVEAAQRLLAEAGDKYAQVLEIKPDEHGALNNWGLALANQAQRAEGEAAQRLVTEAENKYEQALRLAPTETYNLACLRALQGRVEEARELLFVARREGTLPSRGHLLADEDLARLRDLPWFEELIDGGGDAE
jgi:tetratricopeptide (TPR) repeat protein